MTKSLGKTPTPQDIMLAVKLLQAGELVAFPTETVYGLGADAKNANAISKIFHAKERPFDHPLIVHIADLSKLSDFARDISDDAMKLAKIFWPGPLTIIFKKQPQVLGSITAKQDTIGLRIPKHPVAQKLLQMFGGGVAAPSANKFTHVSPTTAEAVSEELGDSVKLILNGGACEVGLESTIIDMSRDQPTILRPGMISSAALSKALEKPVLLRQKDEKMRAPGLHELHYAPQTKTMLVNAKDIPLLLAKLKNADLPVVFLIHSDVKDLGIEESHKKEINWVNMPHDAINYAHDLYRTLRLLDQQKYKRIMIETVPDNADWEAIRDRLHKASSK